MGTYGNIWEHMGNVLGMTIPYVQFEVKKIKLIANTTWLKWEKYGKIVDAHANI